MKCAFNLITPIIAIFFCAPAAAQSANTPLDIAKAEQNTSDVFNLVSTSCKLPKGYEKRTQKFLKTTPKIKYDSDNNIRTKIKSKFYSNVYYSYEGDKNFNGTTIFNMQESVSQYYYYFRLDNFNYTKISVKLKGESYNIPFTVGSSTTSLTDKATKAVLYTSTRRASFIFDKDISEKIIQEGKDQLEIFFHLGEKSMVCNYISSLEFEKIKTAVLGAKQN